MLDTKLEDCIGNKMLKTNKKPNGMYEIGEHLQKME